MKWTLVLIAFIHCLAHADFEATENKSSFFKNRWEAFKSPVTTDAKYLVFIGSAIVGTMVAFEDGFVESTAYEIAENRKITHNQSKLGDYYGRLYPNIAYVTGMGLYGYFAADATSNRRALMMFEATLYSGLTANILKSIVRQKRPGPGSSNDSFPSGHTTSAFAFASVVGVEHGPYLGALAYMGAIFTGYQRMHNSKHYIHDVFGGATIGMAYGLGLHYLNQKKENKDKDIAYMAIPLDDGWMGQVTWRF